MEDLLTCISQCEICRDYLPLGPRPVVQAGTGSKILIIGQAPGKRVHETGIPWNDRSGNKLKEWMKVNDQVFYDPGIISIVPMGFCYPGKGTSGDISPRPECAPLWHSRLMRFFKKVELILLVGNFAQRYYLGHGYKGNLTETVKCFQEYLPQYIPLPHPSPRNQNWMKVNPWFMEEVVPELQNRIGQIIRKYETPTIF